MQVKPARPEFSEDFDALTADYTFAKHASRLLRSFLYSKPYTLQVYEP